MNAIMKHLVHGECLIMSTENSDEVVTFVKPFSDDMIVVNYKNGDMMAPVDMITIPPFVVQKYTAKLEREMKMAELQVQVQNRKVAFTKAQEARKAKYLEDKLQTAQMLVELAETTGDLLSFRNAERALKLVSDEVVDFITGVAQ